MGRCCFIACCWNSCIGPHTTHLMLVKTSLLFISATFYPLHNGLIWYFLLFYSTNLSFVLCQSCKYEFGLWIAI